VGLVIGTAAFSSRRPTAWWSGAQVTAITLIGARARMMRAVQCVHAVLPLSIGLALALVTGKLAEASYLITGGSEIYWDFAGLPLLTLISHPRGRRSGGGA
jgi:hypothetical protein